MGEGRKGGEWVVGGRWDGMWEEGRTYVRERGEVDQACGVASRLERRRRNVSRTLVWQI